MFAPSFDPTTDPLIREFIDGLRELGYTPGRDIVFEYKSAQGNVEALPQVAKELVQSRVPLAGAVRATTNNEDIMLTEIDPTPNRGAGCPRPPPITTA
jgi:ABC-type uncharacterized transport system substrate-binding protein